ncbi:hypothetical protein M1116_00910 [Patescibacteria group bacterium]|nr:hypothetical protein [Patescibacteria group bacterium]
MSRKVHHQEFSITLGHLIRWSIFGVICYFIIQFFSTKPSAPINPATVLGESATVTSIPNMSSLSSNLYDRLSPEQKQQLASATKLFSTATTNLPQFINDQIISIKKGIITQIYQDLIKSIEKR